MGLIITGIQGFAMPIGLFPDMKRGLLVACAMIAGACGVPRSDAGASAPPASGQEQSALSELDPVTGPSDNMLVLPGGRTVMVAVDDTRLSKDGPRDVKVLARHGTLVALSDAYPSKPQGAGLCQAGQETWFRVIDIKARAERYARIVDSCVGSEQWGDPPVTVSQEGARITLNLLSEPAFELTLGNDGRVTAGR